MPEASDDGLDYNLVINDLEIFSLYSVGVRNEGKEQILGTDIRNECT